MLVCSLWWNEGNFSIEECGVSWLFFVQVTRDDDLVRCVVVVDGRVWYGVGGERILCVCVRFPLRLTLV